MTWAKRISSALILTNRIAIGALLIHSGLAKLRQPVDFLGAVYSYELLGPSLGLWIAITLPWLELFTGLLLLTGVFAPSAFLVTTLLGVVFVVSQAYAVQRGLTIDCGCFGSSGGTPTRVGWSTMTRAALLMVCASAGLALSLRRQTTPQRKESEYSPGVANLAPIRIGSLVIKGDLS
jgi:putative oxidoreductase